MMLIVLDVLLAMVPTPTRLAASSLPHHSDDAHRLEKLLKAAVPANRLQRVGSRLARGRAPKEVDVVVSGGGLKGYFLLGARHAIASRDDIVVRRYSGTSAGAWTAMFMATELSSADWLATYGLTAEAARAAAADGKGSPRLMEAYRDYVWPWLQTVLPDDAYERCSGRLHVTVTRLERSGVIMKPRPMVVSEFGSNQELFEACVASSCVPGVTQRGVGSVFQEKRTFDGLFSGKNVPCFTDGARPQLVFNLRRIPYSMPAVVSPIDPSIEGLAVSGALQTTRFLDGRRGNPKFEVVSWRGLDEAVRSQPKESEEELLASRSP